MKITFDAAKNKTNIEIRNLPFERAAEMDFRHAVHMRFIWSMIVKCTAK